MNKHDIGFEHALGLAMENVSPLGTETVAIPRAVGRHLAERAVSLVDSPSVDASLKDGFAVVSADIAGASLEHRVQLEIVGESAAGDHWPPSVRTGQAVRILSGAPIPEGADAVLAEEYTRRSGSHLLAFADARPGRNILPMGTDVRCGEIIGETGQMVTPQLLGLLVAGGISGILAYKRPKIGLLATGNEILLPGQPIEPGKVYASNAALQMAWLSSVGMETAVAVSGDSADRLEACIKRLHETCDVVITSGGAWKGDRDLVAGVLDSMGWTLLFHRIRMGPGKALGMGILDTKPVFCLPGGPASNEAAFLHVVFPAILKIAGARTCPYLYLEGYLAEDVTGQVDWTQFVQCEIIQTAPEIRLKPKKMKSRMAAMMKTPAVIKIPEGVDRITAGTRVPFLCINPFRFSYPI